MCLWWWLVNHHWWQDGSKTSSSYFIACFLCFLGGGFHLWKVCIRLGLLRNLECDLLSIFPPSLNCVSEWEVAVLHMAHPEQRAERGVWKVSSLFRAEHRGPGSAPAIHNCSSFSEGRLSDQQPIILGHVRARQRGRPGVLTKCH